MNEASYGGYGLWEPWIKWMGDNKELSSIKAFYSTKHGFQQTPDTYKTV